MHTHICACARAHTHTRTPTHTGIMSYGNIMVYFVIPQLIDKISLVSGFFLLPVLQCVSFNIYSFALFVTLLHFVLFLF